MAVMEWARYSANGGRGEKATSVNPRTWEVERVEGGAAGKRGEARGSGWELTGNRIVRVYGDTAIWPIGMLPFGCAAFGQNLEGGSPHVALGCCLLPTPEIAAARRFSLQPLQPLQPLPLARISIGQMPPLFTALASFSTAESPWRAHWTMLTLVSSCFPSHRLYPS